MGNSDAPGLSGMGSPLAEARKRGFEEDVRLSREAGGGFLRLSEVAQRLNVPSPVVSYRRERGGILAVPLHYGEWVFPLCQFDGNKVIPGLDAFLRAFWEDINPWTRLSVLLAPSERFGGRTALELHKNGMVGEASSIAGTYPGPG